jgi:hypothetical protein
MKRVNNDIRASFTEEDLERFIKKNKDKFNVYHPAKNHDKRFMALLMIKLRRAFINIAPYLIGVAIATILLWLVTIAIWQWCHLPTLWDIAIEFFKK